MRNLVVVAVLTFAVSVVHGAELLRVGAPFPTWSLVDQTGKTVASKELAGKKYLLWFYPKAMSSGCTAEGNGLRDKSPDFQKAEVEILGVSFDSPQNNARFVEAQRFPFRLLSDTDRKLATAVGAAGSAQQPVARRISYLVGGDGKVLHVYDTVTPASHAADVLRSLPAATPDGVQ